MTLREDLLAFIAPREEEVMLDGKKLVVREWPVAADAAWFQDQQDTQFKFVVQCVFDEAGAQLFTSADIPAIKAGSSSKLMPLIAAVNRVNGFDLEHERKNSEAVPSG